MGSRRPATIGDAIDVEMLGPESPLDVHGMKAGVPDLDHGAFRAAATVMPADMAESEWLFVPADASAVQPDPLPRLVVGETYRTVETTDGRVVALCADVLGPADHDDGVLLPMVLFVPGGGFVTSSRSAALRRRAAVAAAGCVVISIEYRTLRNGTALDGADDVAAAVDWARRHAAEFGGDPDRIGLWGESAGGFLAALAVTSGRVTGVRCVVDVFGLTDLSQVAMDFDAAEQARHHTAEITEAQYVFGRRSGKTIDDDPAAVGRANPVAHVTGSEPAFLLLHGERDGLVSPGQSQLLHLELLRRGATSRRFVVAGAGHYGPEWSTDTVLTPIVDHLREHLAHDE